LIDLPDSDEARAKVEELKGRGIRMRCASMSDKCATVAFAALLHHHRDDNKEVYKSV
jgi:hypothetical protein